MRIGIGLPNTVLGTGGTTMTSWAKRAEERGFATLATIDRIAYPSYESLIALAGAAGATDRIGLFTNLLLEPTRDPVLLAKESASLDQIAGGRLTLGLGVGSRADDFQLVGRAFHDRGRRFDADLELLHRIWAGQPVAPSSFPVAPSPPGGAVALMIGGQPQFAVPRAIRWGAGWTIGGAPPEMAAPTVEAFRTAWKQDGGQGELRIAALSYFSLGDGTEEESIRNLRSYYGHLTDWVEGIAMGAPRTAEAVRQRARAFEDLGVDEFIFDPTVDDLAQVDLLAEAVL